MRWLSDRTGIPATTLSEYLRGKIPRADRALLIARALYTSAEWLFGDLGHPGDDMLDAAAEAVIVLPRYDMLALASAERRASGTVTLPQAWLRSIDDGPAATWLTAMPSTMVGVARTGDVILCRDAEGELIEGCVYLFLRAGSPIVRRVALHPAGLTLVSTDPMIPPLALDGGRAGAEAIVPLARVLARIVVELV